MAHASCRPTRNPIAFTINKPLEWYSHWHITGVQETFSTMRIDNIDFIESEYRGYCPFYNIVKCSQMSQWNLSGVKQMGPQFSELWSSWRNAQAGVISIAPEKRCRVSNPGKFRDCGEAEDLPARRKPYRVRAFALVEFLYRRIWWNKWIKSYVNGRIIIE